MNQLKKRREEYNLTQRELSKKVGTNSQIINLIECEKYHPNSELRSKLADALNTDVNQIFFRSNGAR